MLQAAHLSQELFCCEERKLVFLTWQWEQPVWTGRPGLVVLFVSDAELRSDSRTWNAYNCHHTSEEADSFFFSEAAFVKGSCFADEQLKFSLFIQVSYGTRKRWTSTSKTQRNTFRERRGSSMASKRKRRERTLLPTWRMRPPNTPMIPTRASFTLMK